MKKACLILAIILSNAYAVECYDGSKWRDVPSAFLPKLGIDAGDITHFRSLCREAFDAYIEYEKFKERESNPDDDEDQEEDQYESDSLCIGDRLGRLLGGGGSGIATRAKRTIKTQSASDNVTGANQR